MSKKARSPAPPLASGAASLALLLSTSNPALSALVAVMWLVPQTLFSAVIMRSLWTWFIVPLGPRPINYAGAVGITLILNFARWAPLGDIKSATPDLWWQLNNMAAQLTALAVWWAIAAGFHLVFF